MDVRKIKPVSRTLLLETGEEISLTLNFMLLYRLKGLVPQAYERFFKIFSSEQKDRQADALFDAIDVIYAAYLCHCIYTDALGASMSYEDFLSVLPPDMNTIMTLFAELVQPKKATAFAVPAKSAPATAAAAE